MKPRNFPARKAARQMAAALRIFDRASITARSVAGESAVAFGEIDAARAVRTKKRRKVTP